MHTQGEWHSVRLATPDYAPEFGVYAGDSHNDLARVIGPNSEADARLVQAAPELLALIQELLELHIAHHNNPTHVAARRAVRGATGD